jgi:hypothetical protein
MICRPWAPIFTGSLAVPFASVSAALTLLAQVDASLTIHLDVLCLLPVEYVPGRGSTVLGFRW